MEDFTKKEIVRAVYSHQEMTEVSYGTEVRVPYLNAPRVPGFLCLDPDWRLGLRAILCGFNELVFQPDALQLSFLNLSEFVMPTYPVKTTFENFTEAEIKESALYRSLEMKMELVGKDSNLPFLIEYAPSPDQHVLRAADHVGSFLKIIQELQRSYCGPVVVVIVSPSVRVGDFPLDYLRKKRHCLENTRALYLIGRAIGVPVCKIWVGKVYDPEGGEYHSEGSRWLPLFTPSGLQTAEYFRKLTWKLTELVENLEGYYTTGLERRMASN